MAGMTLVEAAFWSVVHGFAQPTLVLPALVVGWVAPRASVAALGGAAIWGALFLYSHAFVPLPEGASIIWWLLPLGLVPPVAWAWGSFLAFRRLRALAGGDPAHRGLRAIDAVVGALIGAVVVCAAALFAGSVYADLARVSTFEGAAGYLVVFGFGLPGLLAGLVLGAVLGWRRRRRPAAAS